MLNIIIIIILSLVAIKYLFVTAPFVPIHRKDLPRLIEIVEKYSIENFVDLGCGIGSVLKSLSVAYPRRQFTGIEFGVWSYLVCRARFLFCKNVTIKWGNFFWYDWSRYDGLYLFWVEKTIARTRQKIENRLQSGQILVSYVFEIKWLQDKLIEKNQTDKRLPFYVYKF